MSLSSFFAQNAKPINNVKYAVSDRFVTEDGKPEEWEIRALTGKEDKEIRQSCTREILEKRGQRRYELDRELYVTKLSVASTVYPNLNDKGIQDSYGVMCAEELLEKMLTPGELGAYNAKVSEINGYDKLTEADIKEAKN